MHVQDERRDAAQRIGNELQGLEELMARLGTQVHQVLADSREPFRLLFEHSPVGVCLLDEERRLAEANGAFRGMLGLADDIEQLMLGECCHPDERSDLDSAIDEVASAEPATVRKVKQRWLTRQREIRWVEVTAVSLPASEHQACRVLVLVEDLAPPRMDDDQAARYLALAGEEIRKLEALCQQLEQVRSLAKQVNQQRSEALRLHTRNVLTRLDKLLHGPSPLGHQQRVQVEAAMESCLRIEAVIDQLEEG